MNFIPISRIVCVHIIQSPIKFFEGSFEELCNFFLCKTCLKMLQQMELQVINNRCRAKNIWLSDSFLFANILFRIFEGNVIMCMKSELYICAKLASSLDLLAWLYFSFAPNKWILHSTSRLADASRSRRIIYLRPYGRSPSTVRQAFLLREGLSSYKKRKL